MELFNKDGLLIHKVNNCHYVVNCKVENPRLLLNEMFTFEWLQILLNLHPDFIEKYKVFKEDENTAKVFVLLHHFFKDFGVPKLFFFIHVKMNKTPSKIIITQTNEHCLELIREYIKDTYLQVPVNDSKGIVYINTPSSILIEVNVFFKYFITQMEFVEKMAIILCTKTILKTKQVIENLQI